MQVFEKAAYPGRTNSPPPYDVRSQQQGLNREEPMKTFTRFAGLVIMALAFLLVAGQRQAAAQSGGTLERVKQTKVLRDCVDPEYPPDVFKDKDGKFAGFGIELAAQMAKALGAEVQYVETNWDGIIPSLLANKCDIAMTSMTPRPARALVVTFAKVYYPETMALLVKAGDTRTTPEDFNKPDVKLCIQQGTLDEVIWKKFFPQAQGTLLQSQTDCFLQVASGKVDGAPSDYPTTMAFTKA